MLAKEAEVVGLVAAAKARVLHVGLVLLVQRRLLWYGSREMCEGVGEVVTREAAPVRRHRVGRVWLSLCNRVRFGGDRYLRAKVWIQMTVDLRCNINTG